jgi:hypothetical protein
MKTMKIFSCLIFLSICSLQISKAQNTQKVGDTIEVVLDGYKEGKIQWQFSKDKQNWINVNNANSEKLIQKVSETGFFRAKIENGNCPYFADETFIYASADVNTDTIPDVIYMYYKDSITISKILPSFVSGNYTCNNIDFSIKDDKLFLKNPYNLTKVNYNITLINQNTNIQYPLKIKIRCWIKNKYTIYPVITNEIPQFIYTFKDTTFSISSGKLYYSVRNQGIKVFCANLPLEDPMYNQMVCKYGFYAIRTGGKIYVSSNLKNWDLIYDEKRGIKESMVIVNNKNGYELLFSEYTAGTTYVRHYLRSYNLTTKESTVRMVFYTTEDFQKQGLTPHARHIHFLVQDPYTDMIFLGMGDSNPQSAIYFSNDHGLTFVKLGGGSQRWRSLSMLFTEDFIFWNMDTDNAQYIIRLKKSDIIENVNEVKISRYPLINSTHWCSETIELADGTTKMYVMSSNNEGAFYDNNYRNYGIVIENTEPVAYELLAIKAKTWGSQWYPIGTDNQNNILFLDLDKPKPSFYKVVLAQ